MPTLSARNRGYLYRNLWRVALAVVLAGSKEESDQELLLSILSASDVGFRDGAIFAASSFRDSKFIEIVAACAMSTNEGTAIAKAETYILATAFGRWLLREDIDDADLFKLLKSLERPGEDLFRAERLMNYIICPNWNQLPYLIVQSKISDA